MQEVPQSNLTLRGITIPVGGRLGEERVALSDGEYSQKELLERLVYEWVPIVECHGCGRFSYCKFARPTSINPQIGQAIPCGVVVTALDHLLLVSWERLLEYTAEQLQHFFDGAFYFVQFVFNAEMTIGHYIDSDYLNWMGKDLARREFGFISHLRVYLDRFVSEFKELEEFRARGIWVAVEGQTEKSFLERLRELGFYTIYLSGVETYHGKGNATPTKFRLYVKSLQERGYSVVVQGDTDGSKKHRLERFATEGLVSASAIFSFPKDFEGSFPPKILHYALQLAGYNVPLEWLEKVMSRPSHPPIIRIIESKVGQPINKVRLGKYLAEIIAYNWGKIYDKYKDNEIVRWLFFLRTGKTS